MGKAGWKRLIRSTLQTAAQKGDGDAYEHTLAEAPELSHAYSQSHDTSEKQTPGRGTDLRREVG